MDIVGDGQHVRGRIFSEDEVDKWGVEQRNLGGQAVVLEDLRRGSVVTKAHGRRRADVSAPWIEPRRQVAFEARRHEVVSGDDVRYRSLGSGESPSCGHSAGRRRSVVDRGERAEVERTVPAGDSPDSQSRAVDGDTRHAGGGVADADEEQRR